MKKFEFTFTGGAEWMELLDERVPDGAFASSLRGVSRSKTDDNPGWQVDTFLQKFDFSGVTFRDIFCAAFNTYFIGRQRKLRELPIREECVAESGKCIHVSAISTGIESREMKIARLTSLGIPREVAIQLVDNPEKAKCLTIE